MLANDPGRAVTILALEQNHPPAVATVELFLDILASAAGDLALTGMALGGVYVGGGIVPRISTLVNKDRFMTIFSDKGVHQGRLHEIPVAIVTDPLLPLYGAAGFALVSRGRADLF
jgi:glucokinase